MSTRAQELRALGERAPVSCESTQLCRSPVCCPGLTLRSCSTRSESTSGCSGACCLETSSHASLRARSNELLQGSHTLARATQRLDQSHRTLVETDDLGGSVLQSLQARRQERAPRSL